MGIEILRPLGRERLRAAVFDFDGTVSTLRCGWEQVMRPLMLECIAGDGEITPALEAETPPAQEPQAGIRPEVKEVIDRYVEFLVEYVAFLEHYDGSDLSQLSRYMQLYMEYLEYMEKNDEALDDLTDAAAAYHFQIFFFDICHSVSSFH